MKSSPWLLLVPVLQAPLALAMSAFSMWQSGGDSYAVNEEELGT